MKRNLYSILPTQNSFPTEERVFNFNDETIQWGCQKNLLIPFQYCFNQHKKDRPHLFYKYIKHDLKLLQKNHDCKSEICRKMTVFFIMKNEAISFCYGENPICKLTFLLLCLYINCLVIFCMIVQIILFHL